MPEWPRYNRVMASLNATTDSGNDAQTGTGSPQTAAGTGNAAAQTGTIQPGTSSDLLRNANGIQLKNTPVTTVNLNASTQAAPQSQPVARHHVHTGLLVISVILFLFAVTLFWATARSADKTTY